jgi:hypothetical protein
MLCYIITLYLIIVNKSKGSVKRKEEGWQTFLFYVIQLQTKGRKKNIIVSTCQRKY